MFHRTTCLLVLVTFLFTLPSTGEASIRPYRKLTTDQRIALEASQDRLARLDSALHDLARNYARKRISARDYAYYEHDLTCYIAAEAQFQDELLIKPPGLAEDQREILQNIAKYAVLVPLFLAELVARGLCSGESFSP